MHFHAQQRADIVKIQRCTATMHTPYKMATTMTQLIPHVNIVGSIWANYYTTGSIVGVYTVN